jgi:hypothetical protein
MAASRRSASAPATKSAKRLSTISGRFRHEHPKDGAQLPVRRPTEAARFPLTANARRARRLITSPDNPFRQVHREPRVELFLRRGIIEPVDDLRASTRPATRPLDALTKDFVDHFDLRRVMRTIANSAPTRRASRLTSGTLATRTISPTPSAPPRRRAAMDAAGSGHRRAPGLPETPRTPMPKLPDPHVGKDGFLDLFGRPRRESA